MPLRIYEEQEPGGEKQHPFNYMPDDVTYRLPWFMGEDEPPLKALYPLIMKDDKGREIIDPLTIYIGRTKRNKPFAYNPRYVVNPLILIVGTPGAGKSLHPDEEVLVIRGGKFVSKKIKNVKIGDKVFSITPDGNIRVSVVLDVIKHSFTGELIKITFQGTSRRGEVIVTPDHSLLTIRDGKIIPIRGDQVEPDTRLPVFEPDKSMTRAVEGRVTGIEKIKYSGEVYDISTENNTFMLANGLFVHNSATLKTFIYGLLRNELFLEKGQKIPPVIVVDPEGEYAILRQLLNPRDVLHLKLGRRDYINLFDRPSKSISPLAWYMRMMGVIQKFLHISPSQAVQAYRVLKLAILDLAKKKGFTQDPHSWIKDDITLEDVYKWIQNKIDELESQRRMKPSDRTIYRGALTLSSRLDQWMYAPNDAFSHKSTVNLSRLFQYKLIVLDSRGLSKDLFGLFSYWITYWIYGLMLERGPLPTFGVRVVLVIDEAWALLRKTENKEEENPLDALARRGRKYGILIVVATQTPEDVDKKMFSLFGTMVTGIIPSDEMVKKVVESRGMPERFRQEIKMLRQGELVWSINWRKRDFPMSGTPLVVYTEYPIKDSIQVRVI